MDWRAAGLPYFACNFYLRQLFGRRVQKVSVDAGFTCPNVDGTVAIGGCTFCDNRSFSPSRRLPRTGILGQIDESLKRMRLRYRKCHDYLAYFQPATNTYGPVDRLRKVYLEALSHPQVVGLVIGTRPDCVPNDVLDLLQEFTVAEFLRNSDPHVAASLRDADAQHVTDLFRNANPEASEMRQDSDPNSAELLRNSESPVSEKLAYVAESLRDSDGPPPQKPPYVAVEYGMQTMHDRSLDWMNRGHHHAAMIDAVERSRGRGFEISVHVMLGLPGESHDDMMATAREVARLDVDAVKIHNLYCVKGTPLADQVARGEVKLMERAEYVQTVVDFIELLPPTMIVDRISGDAPPDYFIGPTWCLDKPAIRTAILAEFAKRGSWQGSRFVARPQFPADLAICTNEIRSELNCGLRSP